MDVIVLNAAGIVNMIAPAKCKTFREYAETMFLPHIIHQPQNVKHIDLVCDRYLPNSLKQGIRESRSGDR